MKILIVTSNTNALINFRIDLIRSIISKGHNVEVICPRNQDYTELENLNIKFYTIPFSRIGLNPIRDLKTLFEMKKTLGVSKPDLVFSFMIKPVIYGSIASRLSSIENIYSLIPGLGYSFLDSSLKGKLIRFLVSFLYKLSLKFNKKVFFQNNDDIDLFVKAGIIPREKAIKMDGSGVSLETFRRTQKISRKPKFLFVGRILKDKGIVEYIEAVRILNIKYKDSFEAKVVGGIDDNPSGISLEEFNSINFDNVVTYLGHQENIQKVLDESSVFVLPSYREGTPRSALEAMAFEMPIVTTDVPGCREVVIDNENGFMVESKNAESLAHCLEKFIIDPSLIETMGKKSLQIVKEKFEISKVNAAYCHEMGIVPI